MRSQHNFSDSKRTDKALFISVAALTVFTFLVRCAFPVGEWALGIQPAHFVHTTILFSLQILLMPVNIPTLLKFLIAGLLAVPICYLVSMIIRKIPYAKRELG